MRDGESEGDTTEPPSAIVTRRLILRPPDGRDRKIIASLAAHPSVARNLPALPFDRREGGETFAGVERRAGVIVGVSGYGPFDDRPFAVEVATWVGEPHWGRGYATELTQAVIDRAFADACIEIVWCISRAGNARARRVLEKCGFQIRDTGMMRRIQGAVPVERYVLERRNWASLKSWGAAQTEESDAPRNNAA